VRTPVKLVMVKSQGGKMSPSTETIKQKREHAQAHDNNGQRVSVTASKGKPDQMTGRKEHLRPIPPRIRA